MNDIIRKEMESKETIIPEGVCRIDKEAYCDFDIVEE